MGRARSEGRWILGCRTDGEVSAAARRSPTAARLIRRREWRRPAGGLLAESGQTFHGRLAQDDAPRAKRKIRINRCAPTTAETLALPDHLPLALVLS